MGASSKAHKIDDTNRVRIFNNPFLDFFTKTHIAFPLTVFPIFSSVVIYLGIVDHGLTALQTIGIFFSGFLLFTLVEYLIHRNLFHIAPTSEFRKKVQYNLHGIHHDQPKDKKRLAMPIILSTTLAFAFLGGFYLLMGKYAYAFTPGFVMGYATYIGVHFMVHAFTPPKNFFKILWVNHAIHHFKDDTVAYGVSSPLWDVVFRTLPPKKAA